MTGGLSLSNSQTQLGLGFPAPPGGGPPGTFPFESREPVSCVVEYRTLKERRLFGRSKGYRDLTLAGSEPEQPAERYLTPRIVFGTRPSTVRRILLTME